MTLPPTNQNWQLWALFIPTCKPEVGNLQFCDSVVLIQIDQNIGWFDISVDYSIFVDVFKTSCEHLYYILNVFFVDVLVALFNILYQIHIHYASDDADLEWLDH